jgi:IS5 family transposase
MGHTSPSTPSEPNSHQSLASFHCETRAVPSEGLPDRKAFRVKWRCLHPPSPEKAFAHATRSVHTSDLFALVPALALRFEPELAELDRLLDDDQLFQHVKVDLSRRRPRSTQTGGPSTPVEVILRLLVIQHLYAWSYAQTEHFVGDSLVLRQFCRLGLDPVPHHTTLMRWSNLLQPETMHRLLDRVTELACSLKRTRGRKLRIDSTVVATAIHYPTDSTLLFDGVRVLGRLGRQATSALSGTVRRLGVQRTRLAKQLVRRIEATAASAATAGVRAERPGLYLGCWQ